MLVNPNRIRVLNGNTYTTGSVVYWMSRDQRVEHNWALLHAVDMANTFGVPLTVMFFLPNYEQVSTLRQYAFMLGGLNDVAKKLKNMGIGFKLVVDSPLEYLPTIIEHHKVGYLVTDFSPLHKPQIEKLRLSKALKIPVCEVDAHNIVPCWLASDKEEYSAFTFRKKITPVLKSFLVPFPRMPKPKVKTDGGEEINWDDMLEQVNIDRSVNPVKIKPGYAHANKRFKHFLKNGLEKYDKQHNNPNKQKNSFLSPYIHFGHISVQYGVGKMLKKLPPDDNRAAFLEQLIVRRELAENFCFYNPHYNNCNSFRGWVKDTLEYHLGDEREYLYTLQQLENAQTHDELWNAAQKQMVYTGMMHGYLRMYWSKKILEWSETPERAMETAVYLNDKYSLDGNDPNGYAGCAWSIGGVHDRPWKERPVFGKLRYMNFKGCKRKFNVDQFISSIKQIEKSLIK